MQLYVVILLFAIFFLIHSAIIYTLKVIRASKSDARLANNKLPLDIQKLRCRACYEALKFSPQIEQLGKVYIKS